MIYCKMCNYKCMNIIGLSSHLRSHKISSKDYYDKFLKEENEGICYCGNRTKFYSLGIGYKKYCSVKCSSNSKEKKRKIKETNLEKYGVEYSSQSKQIKEKIKQNNIEKYGVVSTLQLDKVKKKSKETMIKKYGVDHPSKSKEIQKKSKKTKLKNNIISIIDDKPLYNSFKDKISYAEEIRRDPEDERFLNVKCKKCDKWFIPQINSLYNRIACLEGRIYGESNFYCSGNCKHSCSIFSKHNYQEYHPKLLEEVRHPLWSKLVKERDNHTCQRCGQPGNIAHHILPVKTHSFFANDIDNGICVCEKCDKTYFHQLDGCKTSELARKVC